MKIYNLMAKKYVIDYPIFYFFLSLVFALLTLEVQEVVNVCNLKIKDIVNRFYTDDNLVGCQRQNFT